MRSDSSLRLLTLRRFIQEWHVFRGVPVCKKKWNSSLRVRFAVFHTRYIFLKIMMLYARTLIGRTDGGRHWHSNIFSNNFK